MRQRNPMRREWLSEEGGFVGHRYVMLVSPAWRARPTPLMKILDRLEVEHLSHAGKQNGNLTVSYGQFESYGVSRKAIAPSLRLGEVLGLLEVVQHGEWVANIRENNTYRLTYVPTPGRKAPTDEWKGITPESVKAALSEYRKAMAKARGEKAEDTHNGTWGAVA